MSHGHGAGDHPPPPQSSGREEARGSEGIGDATRQGQSRGSPTPTLCSSDIHRERDQFSIERPKGGRLCGKDELCSYMKVSNLNCEL